MTIIIETPQPPVRERLVLVREGEPMAPRRDAEPADLERAGWVPQSALDTQVEATLSNIRRAGHLERERDEARAALATMTRQRDDALQVLGQAREALPSDMRDGWLVDAVRRLVRERDEARREAAKLDANLGKTLAAATAAGWDGIENPKAVWDFVAHLARERDEVRRQRDAEIASRDALARVLEQVERERDEARCLYEAAHCERMRITDVLQRVERERDEARAALATWQGSAEQGSAEQERARCVADLRAEAERIRSCTGGAGWAPGTAAAVAAYLDIAADRLERGDHAGTPVPAALPRATDEELAETYTRALDGTLAAGYIPMAPGLRAVAARGRREACLVTRAVEAGVKVTITRTSERMPGCCVGLWDVRVTRRPDAPGEYYSHGVPAADVPKTLARLLGEVTRGR